MRSSIPRSETLDVAVVGLGWWGRIILGLLKASRKLTAVAAVDVAPAAESIALEHGLPFSGKFEDAIADPRVQAVILCTPHSQHCEQIVRAANAKKHVFCEKPLALSRADAARAIAACKANGVALAVGHERRFEPPMLEVQRMAATGELGALLQIEANFSQDKFLSMPAGNWRLSENEAPAGPMTATGIHMLDLSIGLLGPAEKVYARVSQLGSGLTNGDTLGVFVAHQSGANTLISAILATPFEGRFALYGNHGWVDVRDKAHPESPEGWTLTSKLRGNRKQSREYPPAHAVLANLEAFADAAAGRAPYPVPQEQMLANIAALEAVFKSVRSGEAERVENSQVGERE
ncbi:MAG TPA: Gfo/Idh/MocA family oxidoreductase [Burkholderiales bacterium]|nr:Gfo/Idh/MocA family oxidoreductase [Burkholderiales bacterium]